MVPKFKMDVKMFLLFKICEGFPKMELFDSNQNIAEISFGLSKPYPKDL
jgi:hypothetical protein